MEDLIMTKVSKRDILLGQPVALVAKANPKKNPSMAWDRFEVLIEQCAGNATPTVGQLLKAGYRMDDVRHDEAHGYIVVGEDDIKGLATQQAADRAAAIEAARALLAEVEAETTEEVEEPAE
jgi:hypothetical protein